LYEVRMMKKKPFKLEPEELVKRHEEGLRRTFGFGEDWTLPPHIKEMLLIYYSDPTPFLKSSIKRHERLIKKYERLIEKHKRAIKRIKARLNKLEEEEE